MFFYLVVVPVYLQDFMQGSCWTDDHMRRSRKCGGRAQEDPPSAPRL